MQKFKNICVKIGNRCSVQGVPLWLHAYLNPCSRKISIQLCWKMNGPSLQGFGWSCFAPWQLLEPPWCIGVSNWWRAGAPKLSASRGNSGWGNIFITWSLIDVQLFFPGLAVLRKSFFYLVPWSFFKFPTFSYPWSFMWVGLNLGKP